MSEPKIYECGSAAVAVCQQEPGTYDNLKKAVSTFFTVGAAAFAKHYAGEKAANLVVDFMNDRRQRG